MSWESRDVMMTGPTARALSKWLEGLAAGIVFVALALVLASRALYTAPDDVNYIAYFEGTYWTQLTNSWWIYPVEEPLWSLYATSVGNVFGPESALRATIFLSALGFLYASNRLSRGAWLLVVLLFVVDEVLATQMYYNQIRQGVALSVFLLVAVLGGGLLWAALVATVVHSSFFVLLVSVLAALLVRKDYLIFLFILPATLVGVLLAQSFLDDFDLGRRAATYEFAGALNMNYYVVALLQYGLTLSLVRPASGNDDSEQIWYRVTVIFTILALSITMIHEAGARLMYISNALVLILLGQNLWRWRAVLATLFWIVALVFHQLNAAFKLSFGDEDTGIGRWWLILFS